MSTDMQKHMMNEEEREIFNDLRMVLGKNTDILSPIQTVAMLSQLLGLVIAAAHFDEEHEGVLSDTIMKNVNSGIEQWQINHDSASSD